MNQVHNETNMDLSHIEFTFNRNKSNHTQKYIVNTKTIEPKYLARRLAYDGTSHSGTLRYQRHMPIL